MPKVMQINCAVAGSTGKIIGDIADHVVAEGYETLLCAPCAPGTNKNIKYFRTSFPGEQGLYRRLNRLFGYQYSFAPISTMRIKNRIKKEKPDIVHLHCLNGYMVNVYALLRFLKRRKIPTVITNHAEFFYTGGCPLAYECDKWKTGCGGCPQVFVATGSRRDTTAASWRKMKNALSGFECAAMTSVSPWVGARAAEAPVAAELPQYVVMNGVNVGVFAPGDPEQLREKCGLDPDAKIVFHPTASFSASKGDRKGGRFVMELARRMERENVLFLVAGRHTPGLDVPGNMILLGHLADQIQLAEYYALADVTVVAGKSETFNMPVAESLCCGTPVAGFEAGGPESIAIKEHSCFVPYGDTDALEEQVLHLLGQNYDKRKIAEQAKRVYAAETMANGYLELYRKLLSGRGV